MSASLLQAWERTVRRRSADRAIVEAGSAREISFAALDAAANAWARTHARRLAGHAIVFALPNSIAWFEAFIGLLKARAVAVPLDPGEPREAQQRLAAGLRAAAWWRDGALASLPDARRFRESACLVKFTSGSTGQPRPLVFSHRQMQADGRQVMATMGIRTTDLNYALIPLGHSYGLGNLVVPLLAAGVPLVCGSAPLPRAVEADFLRWRPTVFPGVPTMWRALTSTGVELPGLRLGLSAGAPLPPEVARDFAQRTGHRLHAFYGSSETGGISYDRTGRATLAGGVGTALRGVRLVRTPGGRLEVASAAVVTHGNRRRRGQHGAWLMADRVAIDARGGVTLLGRRDAFAKVAGRRVSLAEVAAHLGRLADVRDAWVTVIRGSEPQLAAVIATDRTASALRLELGARVAPWLIPKRLEVIAVFPTTERGKTDVRALEALVVRSPANRAP